MYIKRLIIKNFRGVKEADIIFTSGMNVLIGKNNVGKTTLLYAIDLVTNPNIQWWRRDFLNEFDFWRCDTSQSIYIEVVLACGRASCVTTETSCINLASNGTDGGICKLAPHTLVIDTSRPQTYLNAGTIENVKQAETVVRLALSASYNTTEGFVDVQHNILDENGQASTTVSRAFKEWLGCVLLSSVRDPSRQVKLYNDSLLRDVLGDLSDWRQKLAGEFKNSLQPITSDLSNTTGKAICELLQDSTSNIISNGTLRLSLGELNQNDILKQIEICQVENLNGQEWVVPLSRQGRGLQNIASIILGIVGKGKKQNGGSILLLEEVEQNLEPPLQRNMVRLAQKLTGEDAQFILTTHSPYILSPLLDLTGVQKLTSDKGLMTSKLLSNIKYGRNDFAALRRKSPFDTELLEALFSNLVVIWEGESEAGVYPKLMRSISDYPCEWLAGLCGGNGSSEGIAHWLSSAGYKVVVVIDGDIPSVLEKYKDSNIPFIALPDGIALEKIIAAELEKMQPVIAGEIILSSIGVSGSISNHPNFQKYWSIIHDIFQAEAKYTLDTELVIERYKQSSSPNLPTKIVPILKEHKKRRVHETLASYLIAYNVIPDTFIAVLKKLKEVWDDNTTLGCYQYDISTTPPQWKRV